MKIFFFKRSSDHRNLHVLKHTYPTRRSADRKTNAGTGEVWKGGTGFGVRDDGGERVLEAMTWGFPRHSVNQRTGKPNKPNPVNNARDDKLLSARGMWRPWFLDRKSVV